jgi:hypothetical protein
MIDSVYVLSRLGLEPGMSVTRAISLVGNNINDSTDQLSAANKIIVSLGSKPVGSFVKADIIAKALIEQAVLRGDRFQPEEAAAVAVSKLEKIEQTLPYVFAEPEGNAPTPGQQPSNRSSTNSNDKKAKAFDIFTREAGKTKGEIATIIANEIDITYANAYYYVSRVFSK